MEEMFWRSEAYWIQVMLTVNHSDNFIDSKLVQIFKISNKACWKDAKFKNTNSDWKNINEVQSNTSLFLYLRNYYRLVKNNTFLCKPGKVKYRNKENLFSNFLQFLLFSH